MNLKKLNVSFFYKLFGALIIFIMVLIQFWKLPIISGDTVALFSSSDTLKNCLLEGKIRCQGVIQFGYTQHLYSLLIGTKFSDVTSRLTLYALLNLFCFWLMIYFVAKSSIYILVKFILIFSIFFSPIVAYSVETFSEMSYIFLLFIYTYTLFFRKHLIFGYVAVFLAAGYRESSIIVIFSIYLLSTFINNKDYKFGLKKILDLFPGLIGFLTILLFNLFKNGEFTNPAYESNRFLVNSFSQFSINFWGLFFSPTGGIFGNFWFFIIIPLIFLSYFLYFQVKNSKKFILTWLILLLLNLTVIALTRVPFGWVAFGPRYSMPIFITFILIICFYWQKQLSFSNFADVNIQISRKFLNLSLLFFIPSSLSLISSLGCIFNPFIYSLFDNDNIAACPGIVYLEDPNYFSCTNFLAWNAEPLPFISIKTLVGFNIEFTLALSIFLIINLIYILIIFNKNKFIAAIENEILDNSQPKSFLGFK